MKRAQFAKVCLLTCIMLLIAAMASGCLGGPSSQISEEEKAKQTYLSQVNETMGQLSEGLGSFVDAVSRADVVNMRTQADNAYKALDKLAAIEPPDAYKDVQQGYKDGTAKLRESLDGYISLFTDLENPTFDQSTFDSRMTNIQSLYDEGVKTLKEADEKAASVSKS